MKALVLLLLGLIALAGCGLFKSEPRWAYRSDRDFNRDWYECQKANQYSYTYQGVSGSSSGTTTDPVLAESCMRARGWKKEGER